MSKEDEESPIESIARKHAQRISAVQRIEDVFRGRVAAVKDGSPIRAYQTIKSLATRNEAPVRIKSNDPITLEIVQRGTLLYARHMIALHATRDLAEYVQSPTEHISMQRLTDSAEEASMWREVREVFGDFEARKSYRRPFHSGIRMGVIDVLKELQGDIDLCPCDRATACEKFGFTGTEDIFDINLPTKLEDVKVNYLYLGSEVQSPQVSLLIA